MSAPSPHPTVLALAGVPDTLYAEIAARWEVVDARATRVQAVAPDVLARVQGIACTGRAALGRAELVLLPRLRVVSSYSAGLDGIDEAALQERGIALHNTSHVLAGAVADLAVASLLALLRRVVEADAFVRGGRWTTEAFPLAAGVAGRRVGLLGFGHIGQQIARRCTAFDMEIAYCTRRRREGRPEAYFGDAQALATWADVLVVACSATPQTRGLVDARVLQSLGPQGVLVNIARGAIVDEPALLQALQEGAIAGATLDVFADEPRVPEAFFPLPQVVLTPHIASATHATREGMARAALQALQQHLGPHAPVAAASVADVP